MKILFWILAVLSIPVGLFVTVVSHMSRGLGLSGTVIGEIVCILGTLSIAVCIVGIVLGVLQLRKGKAKKAVVFVLAGILYSAAIMAGVYIDDALHTVRMNADIAERDTELYGENWNAPPNMEGIPEHYWEELNKCYAMVRDRWPSEETGNYGLLTMPGYYGEASLDNIGFLLKDLNGDGIEELAIGAVVPEENGGTAIFGIYGDPENVFMFPSAHEERIYYLHPGQTEGSYLLEIAGMGTPWMIMPATEADRSISVEDYQGAPLEPSQRMTLELIPFSQYK